MVNDAKVTLPHSVFYELFCAASYAAGYVRSNAPDVAERLEKATTQALENAKYDY